MGLKVLRVMPDDLAEARELRLHLDDALVEVDDLASLLEGCAVGAAAVQPAVLVEEARDERRVGAGGAQAEVGVLADGDAGVLDPLPAARGLGHVGHEAGRAHQALVDGAGDAEVDGVAVADVVGTDEQLLHGVLLCE